MFERLFQTISYLWALSELELTASSYMDFHELHPLIRHHHTLNTIRIKVGQDLSIVKESKWTFVFCKMVNELLKDWDFSHGIYRHFYGLVES